MLSFFLELSMLSFELGHHNHSLRAQQARLLKAVHTLQVCTRHPAQKNMWQTWIHILEGLNLIPKAQI